MGFIKTIKVFYKYGKPFRKQFLFGLISLLIVDLLNAFPALVLKNFIDQVALTFKGDRRYLPFVWLGIVYLSIALGQGFCRYLWRRFLIHSSFKTAEIIREDYFAKLQNLPPAFYHKNAIGDLMSLATNDIEAIRFALGPGLLVFADAVFLFISLPPAMLFLSPKLTAIVLAPMLFVPFVVSYAEKLVHDRFEKVQAQFSKLSAFAQENIEGIHIVKAFVREWTQLKRFHHLGKEFVKLNVKLTQAQSIFEPVFVLAVSLGLVSLFIFAGKDIIAGTVSIGTFVAFTHYLDQLVWPLMAFGLAVTHYQRGKTSMERILEVLVEPQAEAKETSFVKLAIPSTDVLLEVKNLTFSYPEKNIPALKNVSFKIKKGSKVAFVGIVGSGKSTLVKLIAGFYEIPPATFFWNGQDMATIPLVQRRELLAIVPQDLFLFSDSLKRNLLIGAQENGHPELSQDGKVTKYEPIDEVLHSALFKAGLEKEVKNWGLNALVGERGLNLSGGQKARTTVARALLRDTPLLILDDALSSIDAETETKILNNLEQNKPEQALLMITHRFTRLWKFHQVLVFNQGEIIQNDTPANLSHTPGLYKQLLELQRIENELES